ncbi:MAG: flagellar motor protein MotB [Clostridiales bacterium]|jgi:chemotaxis protein MotB|nr:flagellar motor protein MotB [Clostridiales bacterium]
MAAKRKPEEPPSGAPEWMATYGDLVTLLLCFFVLLYAMSNVDQKKFAALAASFGAVPQSVFETGSAASINELLGNGIMEMPDANKGNAEDRTEADENKQEAVKELQNMASDFKTYLADNNLEEKVALDLTDAYIRLNLPEEVLFDSGSAELKIGALPILDVIATALIEYPASDVEVEGHADDRPINTIQYKNNWYLSSARATEVTIYLVDNKGINPDRIVPVGYGEYKPVASNDSEEGRAKNRRVEIVIRSRYDSGSAIDAIDVIE